MIRKLGLVLECDAGGPDELVLKCLTRRLSPKTETEVVTHGNKQGLFLKGIESARQLVEVGKCDLVLVVWDLKPYWQGPPPTASCEQEALQLREAMASVPEKFRNKIRLLCLTYELETWLMVDERAIREHVSTSHKFKYKAPDWSERTDPKAYLNTEFTKFRGKSRRYVDRIEAIQISALIEDTSRLRKVPSFQRFTQLLVADRNANFSQDGSACAKLVHKAFMLGK